jgi:hypothetical protein
MRLSKCLNLISAKLIIRGDDMSIQFGLCVDCGEDVGPGAKRCVDCHRAKLRRDRLSREKETGKKSYPHKKNADYLSRPKPDAYIGPKRKCMKPDCRKPFMPKYEGDRYCCQDHRRENLEQNRFIR